MSGLLRQGGETVVYESDRPPERGLDGRGIESVAINEAGELVLRFTDKTEENHGRIAGDKGKDGRSLESIEVAENGDVVVTFDGEEPQTIGNVKGNPGEPGRAVSRFDINRDGDLIAYYTDQTSEVVGRVVGPRGKSERAQHGKDGRSILTTEINDAGELVFTFSDDTTVNLGRIHGKDADPGEPGKPGRGLKKAVIDGGGFLVFSYTDDTVETIAKIVPDMPPPVPYLQRGRITDDGDLILVLNNGVEISAGKLPVRVPEDGRDGRGLRRASIDADGHLVFAYTDDTEEDIGRVRGDPGEPGKVETVTVTTPGGPIAPKGRTLFGKSGRLTSDRKPPGAANTLNIPDGFARTVLLLISDGTSAGMAVQGLHKRADGVTTWEEWRREGAAPVLIYADAENAGLAVEATQPGNWTCRMVASE